MARIDCLTFKRPSWMLLTITFLIVEPTSNLEIINGDDSASKSPEEGGFVGVDPAGGKKVEVKNSLEDPDWFFSTPDLKLTVEPKITIHPVMESPKESIPRLTIEMQEGDHRLILDVKPTRDLLASSYREPESNNKKGKFSHLPCEYQGYVRGLEADSMVALSICPVIRGIISAEGTELTVEEAPGSASPEAPHQITSNSDLGSRAGSCGVNTESKRDDLLAVGSHRSWPIEPLAANRTIRKRRQALKGRHDAKWTETNTLFIELVLVADYSFYRAFKDGVYDRCRSIVNIVNALFREIGVVVVLTDLEVWKSSDQTAVSSDYNRTLTNFKSYRDKLLRTKPEVNNDNTVLITTVDFIGDTVGYAYVGGICSTSQSAAVVQDKKTGTVGSIAKTMAHEMGHNLGMTHDENFAPRNCCLVKECLMAKRSSSLRPFRVGWSECSKETVEEELDLLNYDCLRNVPEKFYQRACGNGVLDDGEQCDCGPKDFCDNACCDPETCKLVGNATCAHGACCNLQTCRVHKAGRVCREAKTECDLPEFCSAMSEFCPDDVHIRDGTPCDDKQGYCYKGRCGSPSDKCKKVYGDTALLAHPKCYELNERGDEIGSCGWTDRTRNVLKKCSPGSLACGTLHCNPKEDKKLLIQPPYRYGSSTYGSRSCHYVIGVDTTSENLWLVSDGSPCGNGMEGMCVNQKCVKIQPPDGSIACPKNCSGHGVCNSKGNCHCNKGYAPPDCYNRGHGGSIDSNYIDPNNSDYVEDVILLLLAILIPIIAIICCCWEKIRILWDTWGSSSMERTCPSCAACMNACCCPVMSKITHWCVTVGKRKDNVSPKETKQIVEQEDASTICQVTLDLKQHSQTNSWGVADERLFTEVVNITPKNSPDISRKIVMKGSPGRHHKSTDGLDRVPPYQHQSISVDSGCVSDDEVEIHRPVSSQMSMTSLIGAFSKFGNKSVKGESNKDTAPQRLKGSGSQKSLPLSRIVVDPLAGSRRSRHGTPPPEDFRHSFNRSYSTDATTTRKIHRQELPQPPSGALKPHKSDENVHKVSRNPAKRWSLFGKSANQNGNSDSRKGQVVDAVDGQERKPMLPTDQSGKPIPQRCPPPPPPPMTANHTPKSEVTVNSTVKKPVFPPDKKPLRPPGKAPNFPKSQEPKANTRKIIFPPDKKPIMPFQTEPAAPKGQEETKSTEPFKANNSRGPPLLPPASKPNYDPRDVSSGNGGNSVRDLARKMEKQ